MSWRRTCCDFTRQRQSKTYWTVRSSYYRFALQMPTLSIDYMDTFFIGHMYKCNQGVGYELTVFHGINVNHTLLADYKRWRKIECMNVNQSNRFEVFDEPTIFKTWESQSGDYLRDVQLTDVTLLCDPVAIAVSSILSYG